MDNFEMARASVKQALERVETARRALYEGHYAYAVRQSQEAVELLLKAALRLAGVEPPKWHDVGPVLRRERERFPEWFRDMVDDLASISRSLSRERELAMYGDEDLKIPPDELYVRKDAEKALADVELVLRAVQRLMEKA
ncbi:MAG: HEPN domain-containing protein [Candidatus Caldarchaeum sp.]|nr:HEPN domain-containing protein [Candidatus Caldarchaeum sp.]